MITTATLTMHDSSLACMFFPSTGDRESAKEWVKAARRTPLLVPFLDKATGLHCTASFTLADMPLVAEVVLRSAPIAFQLNFSSEQNADVASRMGPMMVLHIMHQLPQLPCIPLQTVLHQMARADYGDVYLRSTVSHIGRTDAYIMPLLRNFLATRFRQVSDVSFNNAREPPNSLQTLLDTAGALAHSANYLGYETTRTGMSMIASHMDQNGQVPRRSWWTPVK